MKHFFSALARGLVILVLAGLAVALLLSGCSFIGGPSPSSSSAATSGHTSTSPSSSGPAATPSPRQSSTSEARSTTSTTERATTSTHRGTANASTIAEKLKPSVVGVTALLSQTRTETIEAVGTGVVYSAAGLIVTNNHVIAKDGGAASKHITVTLPSGKTVAASLVGRDPTTDIALLQVHAGRLHPATFRTDLSLLEAGDFAVAIGNPKVLSHPVTSGRITAVVDDVVYKGLSGVNEVIESSVPLDHGNSGGPLVDAQGRVIGINVAEMVDQKAAITLPADLVVSVVRHILAGE